MTDSSTAQQTGAPELVVLVDEAGVAIGVADKALVHHRETPRHLAFSVHVTDDAGDVLLSRRAITKATWPGVWTNACCGHPAPGDDVAEAARRRVGVELGLEVTGLDLVLPEFSYRAVDAAGVVENELCPVFTGRVSGRRPTPQPDPTEVADVRWVTAHELDEVRRTAAWMLSPWMVGQLDTLAALRTTAS